MLRQVVVFTAAVIAGAGGGLALSYGDGWQEAHLPSEVRAWVAGRLALLHGDSWREAHLPGEAEAWLAGGSRCCMKTDGGSLIGRAG